MGQRHRIRAAYVCLLWLLTTAGVARAQGLHTLEGRVVLPDGGQPRNPVRVSLTYNGRHVYETFTDLSGRFSFTALANGRYRLTAEGDDRTFETTTVYAEVTAFGPAPQTFTQNIQLIAKQNAAAAAAPVGTISAEELDPDVPATAREKYQRALKSAAGDKSEQAAKLLAEAVREYPPFYAAHFALAEQYAKLKRYDAALAAYRRASELKPDRAEPYVGIGVTLVNQRRYDEGIALLRRLVELDEKMAAPYLTLGYAEMMTGDYGAAEKHLLRASELNRTPIAHIYLANVYEQLDAPAKAVEHLQAYLKESPQSPNAESVRGAIEKLRKKMINKK